ncbi:MAG TPA: DUF5946 family protein [Ktedonobacterales bacterium]|jgi:hypothetical protein|nr:DUF5946 family protein [Ktedonobacterales bacterium]
METHGYQAYRDCPGCGLSLPVEDVAADARFYASPECQRIYGELTGYTVMLRDTEFIHQHLVDAYAAQHVGDGQPTIGAAFALIGLYLAVERGYTGKQVQRMHMLLARRSKTWPRFTRPAHVGALTALDVLNAQPGAARKAHMMLWARSVWDAWEGEHERVKALLARVMAD